jgi:hypothetical protein
MRRLVCLTALLMAALAACGGDDGADGGGGPATLKVGVLPIADVAPLYVGERKGFFKEAQLTIEPQVLQGGAEVTAAFVSEAKAGGARSLGSYLTGFEPKLTVGTYFGATPYIDGNEDVVERFARAMSRSLAYIPRPRTRSGAPRFGSSTTGTCCKRLTRCCQASRGGQSRSSSMSWLRQTTNEASARRIAEQPSGPEGQEEAGPIR